MSRLLLVPTPLGNLEDMTLRGISVLKSVQLILAEDTRTSGVLLKHFGIETRLFPYHQHNEHKIADAIVKRIAAGEEMALITDAGTPGISDPGFLLVRACIKEGIEVECLPGANAIIPALVMSGLPCDRFVFEGFLPVKKGRKTRLTELADESRTIVFYESPHRIPRTLRDLSEHFGPDRPAAACREISKKFAENRYGSLAELSEWFNTNDARGEFVLVIAGSQYKREPDEIRES